MSKVALIGQKDLVSLFAIAGIDTFGIKDVKDSEVVLREVCEKDYSIVLITESAAINLIEYINRINLEGKIYIMVIADHTQKEDISRELLKRSVEKAVGADILFRE